MDQHRCTEQSDHQHDADGGDGADHHQGGDHNRDETQLIDWTPGGESALRIDADKHQIPVANDQQQQQCKCRNGRADQIRPARSQDVAKQQGFQVNAHLQQRDQKHTERGESSQNRVHGGSLPPAEALIQAFGEQGSDQTTDQSTKAWIQP